MSRYGARSKLQRQHRHRQNRRPLKELARELGYRVEIARVIKLGLTRFCQERLATSRSRKPLWAVSSTVGSNPTPSAVDRTQCLHRAEFRPPDVTRRARQSASANVS